MRAIWIILLIILGLIIIVAGIVGYTVYQGYEIVKIVNDEEFRKDFEGLANGDCDKLPGVERKIQEINTKVVSGCKNPILKWVIESQVDGGSCSEIGEKTEEVDKVLDDIKTDCSEGEFDASSAFSCNEDSDCALTEKECCSCLNDVTQVVAINKNFVDMWNSQLGCTDVACTNDCVAGTLEARCVENTCLVLAG